MKVNYRVGDENSRSTAYLDDEPVEDGSYVGLNKHTNLPVHLRWDREAELWREVCEREWEFEGQATDRWREVGERPACTCVGHSDEGPFSP